LASGSNGINPLTQAVTLQVGTYAVTFPAGSFKKTSKGVYVYQGSIGGVALQMQIASLTSTSFSFKRRAAVQISMGL
jgi:hypothetical protein